MNRVSIILAAILVASATTARAQAPGGAAPHGYFAGVDGGFTAGHGAAALVDVDLGKHLNEGWDVYVEVGRMLDTRTADLDTSAKIIAGFLGTSATYTAKQPTNYGAVGVRYKIPMSGRLQPYAGVGIGVAKVTRNVNFLINGTNVNGVLLDTYGVQLGTDLSGSETKALVTFSLGTQIPVSRSLFADLSYRFGRVFLTDAGLNTSRIQFGIGMRFK